MKKIVVVTPEDTSHGFSLAGVRQVATSAREACRTLRALASEPSTGVLAVDERLVTTDVQGELEAIERQWPALVVVVPAPLAGERMSDDYALRLIRKAIGYQVRVHL